MARALSKKLTVSLDDKTHEELLRQADDKDLPAAALVRSFIKKGLEKAKKTRVKETC